MDSFQIALVVLLSGVIASRFVAEAGLKVLDAEQKAALIDACAPVRKYGLPVLLVIFVATYQYATLLLALAVAYILVTQVITYRQVYRLDLPAAYLRRFHASSAVSLTTLAAFFAMILYG